MYRKNCERCHRPSFSSSEVGKWICPVCGHDLTNHPFFNAITLEKAAVLPRWKQNTYTKEHVPTERSSNLWG